MTPISCRLGAGCRATARRTFCPRILQLNGFDQFGYGAKSGWRRASPASEPGHRRQSTIRASTPHPRCPTFHSLPENRPRTTTVATKRVARVSKRQTTPPETCVTGRVMDGAFARKRRAVGDERREQTLNVRLPRRRAIGHQQANWPPTGTLSLSGDFRSRERPSI